MQRFGFLLLLGLVLLVPGTVFCADVNADSRLTSFDHQVISEVQALRPPPKQGWFKGTIAGKAYDVIFNRVAWTITGKAGDKPFDIKIDHEAKTIRGYAHDSGVVLDFTWSPDEVTFDGSAYGSPYWTNISWPGKTVSGGSACSMLELQFDLDLGTIDGFLGDRKITLKYDKVSGRLTGDFARRAIDLQLVNLDLSDFIQHLYLFIK